MLMSILIVGNILKDIDLNLDNRSEAFEQDKNHTKWLNLSFNASEHHYFNRHSSIGGATISLQVLTKLGLDASISGSNLSFDHENLNNVDYSAIKSYRYILVSDDGVCYITPSKFEPTTFTAPSEPAQH